MPRATTCTCGRKCSTRTATTPSSRRATRSTPGVAARLLRYVYASGATLEPAEAFRAFRGRDPRVGPMLAQRGLVEEAQPA